MRIEQLTFSRFLAAISIVVFHYGRGVFPFNQDEISFFFKQANIGVSYFFLLSGFVMCIAYGNRSELNTLKFLRARFARIYPIYILAILLLLAIRLLTDTSFSFKNIFLNTIMLQAWIPGKALSFNYPGWSLSVEFFFYISFPYLFNKIYRRYKLEQIALFVIIFWIINQIVFNLFLASDVYNGPGNKIHQLLFYFPLMHLNEFLLGNIVGLFFVKRLKYKRGYFDFFIIILLIVSLLLLKYPLGLNYHNGLLLIIFVPIVLFLSLNDGFITQLFTKKIFIFLGEISYGVYILQFPVFMWSKRLLKIFNIDNIHILFYTSFVALIVVSSLSYKYVEIPLRNKIKNADFPNIQKKIIQIFQA